MNLEGWEGRGYRKNESLGRGLTSIRFMTEEIHAQKCWPKFKLHENRRPHGEKPPALSEDSVKISYCINFRISILATFLLNMHIVNKLC